MRVAEGRWVGREPGLGQETEAEIRKPGEEESECSSRKPGPSEEQFRGQSPPACR